MAEGSVSTDRQWKSGLRLEAQQKAVTDYIWMEATGAKLLSLRKPRRASETTGLSWSSPLPPAGKTRPG
jgi:hypothetical protein